MKAHAPSLRSKIKSSATLSKLLKGRQKSAKKNTTVIFTNGCFDILHTGHVTYLEKAKRLGNILVVALNTDKSVQALKGPERPIHTLLDRMHVIAALGSVDYVTWFDEETPLSLILRLRPDVLVKGGDWKANQIVGSKEVLSWGGRVNSIPFVEGHSTTASIQRARKQAGNVSGL